MAEKDSPEVAYSHNEKAPQTHEPDLADGARRGSVALNIVQNPLKVSSSSMYPLARMLITVGCLQRAGLC